MISPFKHTNYNIDLQVYFQNDKRYQSLASDIFYILISNIKVRVWYQSGGDEEIRTPVQN